MSRQRLSTHVRFRNTKCSRCGDAFVMKVRYYPLKRIWAGKTFCRKCENVLCIEHQLKKRDGTVVVCSGCGKNFTPTNRQFYRMKKGLKPFCSSVCRVSRIRKYPSLMEHPLCLAPVPGGCNRFRYAVAGHVDKYCHAHRQRVTRGRPVDTPVQDRNVKKGS